MVAYLAARVAFGATNTAASGEGALAAVAGHPGGRVVLCVLAAGFAGYAVLAFVEAAFRQRGERRPADRWAKRLGYGAISLAYAGFCAWTLTLVLHPSSGQASSPGTHARETELTARVLRWHFGQALVGGFGVIAILVAIGFGWQAVTTSFDERLDRRRMSRAVWRVATVLGVVGGAARAVVLALVGAFVLSAAATFDPRKARGLDASLRTVAQQPYGPYLLAAVALGLACYGAFLFLEVGYRKV
jgi:uncharacterized membrane protein